MMVAIGERVSSLSVRPNAVPGSLVALVEPEPGSNGDLVQLVETNRVILRDALLRNGALLFRGFAVLGAEQFAAVSHSFSDSSYSYVGGASPRSRVSGEVFTSTEYAADAHMLLHNEASYFRAIPDFIWFHCVIAPEEHGETPLGDMRKVLGLLEPELVARFASRGVMYVTNLHGGKGFGKSWQQAYQSDDRDVVDKRLREMGLEHSWSNDGQLRVLMKAPGIRKHAITGDRYWGNQAASFHPASLPPSSTQALRRLYKDPMKMPKAAFYGDGGEISDEDINSIATALISAETVFKWQVGDVMLVDNQSVAHGRRSFKGKRQILVSLS
jgi:alpha-ketoglutarate-dependent taurine dioxygenase